MEEKEKWALLRSPPFPGTWNKSKTGQVQNSSTGGPTLTPLTCSGCRWRRPSVLRLQISSVWCGRSCLLCCSEYSVGRSESTARNKPWGVTMTTSALHCWADSCFYHRPLQLCVLVLQSQRGLLSGVEDNCRLDFPSQELCRENGAQLVTCWRHFRRTLLFPC